MILLTDAEFLKTKKMVENSEKDFRKQESDLAADGLTSEQIKRAMAPNKNFIAEMKSEVQWYENAKKGHFLPITDFIDVGRTLIALRIASGMTQSAFAERLGVPQSNVSRDENNEYHGITVERAQKILSALGANVVVDINLTKRHAA